jgi:hypothetical protein
MGQAYLVQLAAIIYSGFRCSSRWFMRCSLLHLCPSLCCFTSVYPRFALQNYSQYDLFQVLYNYFSFIFTCLWRERPYDRTCLDSRHWFIWFHASLTDRVFSSFNCLSVDTGVDNTITAFVSKPQKI